MDRIIKFRAWDKEKEYFANVQGDSDYAITWDTNGSVYVMKDGTPMPNGFILEEWTGLLDKNGVEIYEGDKLQIFKHFSDKRGVPEVEHRGVIFFQNGKFCIKDDGSAKWEEGTYGLGNPAYAFNLEVIGNVHESVSQENN